jgi:anhydro-N-acetylmuramic acid kinase
LKPVYYIGIMSGTSLDGIDVVLADFSGSVPALHQTFFIPYDETLRSQLLALHQSGDDELNRAALLSNQLSHLYAEAVISLLSQSNVACEQVIAIGCHGQTVRHCPEADKNYTIQLVNAALLAELTQVTVVADFRSRDIAAGGQGAPLVPAFHQAIFMSAYSTRAIVNIGGIANITRLESDQAVIGFDCGPGNLLLDAWCLRHTGQPYDKNGDWAAQGKIIPDLLEKLLATQFFSFSPPKSTGRDFFNIKWLEGYLSGNEALADVQATLLQLTVSTIADAIQRDCLTVNEVYVCGGGAHNKLLIERLREALPDRNVSLTDELGVAADWVEAYAFAWLAQQVILGKPINLSAVTGAKGERILGAIYPA